MSELSIRSSRTERRIWEHGERHRGKPRKDQKRRRRVIERVCRLRHITDGARMTAVTMLNDWSDPTAKHVWPSQRKIAERRGLSERTICSHIGELERAGVLTVTRAPIVREHDGTIHRARTNRYIFDVPTARPTRKRSSHRHENPFTPIPLSTRAIDKSLRAPRKADANCPVCEGDGFVFDEGGGGERQMLDKSRRPVRYDIASPCPCVL